MNPTRKLLGAAAFSLALAGGGVAGALLGTPTFSSAQDDTANASTESAGEGSGRFVHRGEGLAAAADALGMSADDLRSALQDGKSIAQVAEDQGVDVQTVIDALVADATTRLNELEASLPERMTELVNRTGWGDHDGGGDHEGPGGRHPRLRHLGIEAAAEAIGIEAAAEAIGIEAAAEAIGISADELRTALVDGASVADVAEANGVDVQTVIDALVAEATARLDEAVVNGKIDADRAEEIKANLVDRITAHVNGHAPTPPDGALHEGDLD